MHNLGSRGVIPEALKGVAWYPYLKNYEGVQEDSRMLDDKMITMDGYDDCMLGICMRFGQDDIVAYDYTKIIQKHIDDGMTDEEAVEFFNFILLNVLEIDLRPHTWDTYYIFSCPTFAVSCAKTVI